MMMGLAWEGLNTYEDSKIYGKRKHKRENRRKAARECRYINQGWPIYYRTLTLRISAKPHRCTSEGSLCKNSIRRNAVRRKRLTIPPVNDTISLHCMSVRRITSI